MAREPNLQRVYFEPETGYIAMELRGGLSLGFLARNLKGLETTSDEELADVKPIGCGTALHFPKLDQHYGLTALIEHLFGVKTM